MDLNNIYSNIPSDIPDEIFEEILRSDTCRIERIISLGHTTLRGAWYDQTENEWVILLKGKARLTLESSREVVEMNPGDYIHIPAHCRHRVEYTDPNGETLWLAIHY
jgi:cupin 2 domain-containing protein